MQLTSEDQDIPESLLAYEPGSGAGEDPADQSEPGWSAGWTRREDRPRHHDAIDCDGPCCWLPADIAGWLKVFAGVRRADAGTHNNALARLRIAVVKR